MSVKNFTEPRGLSRHVNPVGRPVWNSFEFAHQDKLLGDDVQSGVSVSLVLVGSFVVGLIMIAIAVLTIILYRL